MSEETKMVEMLRSVDHGSVEDCFLQSPLFEKAAAMIERLVRERKEAQEDESSLLLIAHLDGAARGRKAGLEEAAKVADGLTIGGCACEGYGCTCGNYDDAGAAGAASTAVHIAAAIRALGEKTE